MKVGEILRDKYQIKEVVAGDGTNRKGISNLYRAEDITLGSTWAIKEVIKDSNGRLNSSQALIIREAKIMRKLQHPSIPRIVSIDNLPDKIIIVMDWVTGKSVGQFLRAGGISIEKGLYIVTEVTKILSYLHNKEVPILYKDMKPENIMFDPRTMKVTLIDFGISVEVPHSKVEIKENTYTRGFFAPESVKPSKAERQQGIVRYYDLRSDIYSLGWTMFNIFTNILPSTYQERCSAEGVEPTGDISQFNKSVSPALANIVMRCVRPLPEERYQNLEELLYDLENLDKLDGGYYKKLKKKVNTVFAIASCGLLLGLGSLAPLMLHRSQQANYYKTLEAKAARSKSVDDYVELLNLNPKEIDPYFGLVEAISGDGSFSEEEESLLLDYVNPNSTVLGESSRWGELSFEIGRLYWLYTDREGSRLVSSRWFEDAKGYNEMASIFSSIGSFDTKVIKLANEGSDNGIYLEQWKLLSGVNGQSDLITLQVMSSKLELVEKYGYRLKSDGLGKDEILAYLEEVKSYRNGLNIDGSTRLSELSLSLGELVVRVESLVKEIYDA